MQSPSRPSRAAAADLIRNLDAALSDMTAAAASAAEDAARARRNARAAGEVARRYGGALNKGKGGGKGGKGGKIGRIGGSGRKKRGSKGADADNLGSSLLERKRERRAAARMAAEARQRREHPLLHSPRRLTSPIRAPRGVNMEGTPVKTSSEWLAEAGARIANTPERGARDVSIGGAPPVESPAKMEADNVEALVEGAEGVGMVDGATVEMQPTSDTSYGHESPQAAAAPYPPLESKGSNATMDEFEDAMEHYPEENIGREERGEAEPTGEESQMGGQGAPPTGGYYTQPPPKQVHFDEGQTVEDANQWQNNVEYYIQNPEQQYYQQPETQQPYPEAGQEQMPQPISPPKQKHSIPPTPPRSQPTLTTRIEASHAEDVLTLSLELERARSQLAASASQLEEAQAELATIKSQNEKMNGELTNVHSQLETHNERSTSQMGSLQERFDLEQRRAKAAEEDAALALELAKEAQGAKEECEMWLTRSLEEIDLWKGKCLGMERKLQETEQETEEPKKSVRFKDECPPSPVVSEDGGYAGEDPSPIVGATPPPPPPPPPRPEWSTPQSEASGTANWSAVNSGIFSPTPSQTAIACGRAFLHRASPSPRRDGGLSPDPRQRAAELLKRSAATRRLLRERLTPGRNALPLRPPVGPPSASKPSSDDGSFANRQGAACKAVGKAIRESGARLRLEGKWWTTPLLTNEEGTDAEPPVIDDVAQLESMVRAYCVGVEARDGKQKKKIDELLAFCDHLEKDLVSSRV
ncbi:hypothetical protein ACHAXT_009104 [Thalassiosira profunda]